MKAPEQKPTVKLTGIGGNVFLVLGIVMKALSKAGADREYVNQYMEETMSADYNNLLAVTMKYVNVT